MVEMGEKCGFPSNFDMPRPFNPRKTELSCKVSYSQPIKSPNNLLHPRVEEEQRIHSGDEIGVQESRGVVTAKGRILRNWFEKLRFPVSKKLPLDVGKRWIKVNWKFRSQK